MLFTSRQHLRQRAVLSSELQLDVPLTFSDAPFFCWCRWPCIKKESWIQIKVWVIITPQMSEELCPLIASWLDQVLTKFFEKFLSRGTSAQLLKFERSLNWRNWRNRSSRRSSSSPEAVLNHCYIFSSVTSPIAPQAFWSCFFNYYFCDDWLTALMIQTFDSGTWGQPDWNTFRT